MNIKTFTKTTLIVAFLIILIGVFALKPKTFDAVNTDIDTEKTNSKVVTVESVEEGIMDDYTRQVREKIEVDARASVEIIPNEGLIEIKDESYIYTTETIVNNIDKYDGRTIKMQGMVQIDDTLGKNRMFVGKFVIHCCPEDAAMNGFVCEYEGTEKFKQDEWIELEGTMKMPEDKDGWPYVKVLGIKKIGEPKQPYLHSISESEHLD